MLHVLYTSSIFLFLFVFVLFLSCRFFSSTSGVEQALPYIGPPVGAELTKDRKNLVDPGPDLGKGFRAQIVIRVKSFITLAFHGSFYERF